jgi:hypothetical protein
VEYFLAVVTSLRKQVSWDLDKPGTTSIPVNDLRYINHESVENGVKIFHKWEARYLKRLLRSIHSPPPQDLNLGSVDKLYSQ